MNRIESFVYHIVKNNHYLKNVVRNLYQGCFDLLPNYDSIFSDKVLIRENCFFGFHDLNPFDVSGKMHLCNRLQIPLRMPTKGETLEVGYWYGEHFDQWEKVGETDTWNYHKGCRLQWVDAKHCIFNISEKETLKSLLVNIETHEEKVVDWPIDTVSPDGHYATSFSYERLQKMMPGYGYLYGDADSNMSENISKNTGLFLIDLERNERRLLLSLEQIASFEAEDGMRDTFHFVTHTSFSFDYRYISFLHRWYRGIYRRTRLIVYDTETGRMYASPTTGMVSHYAWNRKNGIIAYCSVDHVDSHVYFASPMMKEWKRCAYPQLNSDGHHHFMDDEWFLVDTYPDRWRHCQLYQVNCKTDEVVMLADVKSPKQFVSPDEQHWWKCDLHPRCDAAGLWVSFDSVHTGTRSLCLMKRVNKTDG